MRPNTLRISYCRSVSKAWRTATDEGSYTVRLVFPFKASTAEALAMLPLKFVEVSSICICYLLCILCIHLYH